MWARLFVLLLLIGCARTEDRKEDIPEQNISAFQMPQVCLGDDCFQVEIADSTGERTKGLMYREYLQQDHGMLFIFDEPDVHRFWMKNTLIPLDIIWLDGNGTVVYISENTQPCKAMPCPSYGPSVPAKYVLEINSGLAKEKGIAGGDVLRIDLG
jgi:uncharacterized protein